jgi:hypothetical protein
METCSKELGMLFDFRKYGELIEAYLFKGEDVDAFVERYIRLWMHDVKHEDDDIPPEVLQQEEELLRKLKAGALSEDEYERQRLSLFNKTREEVQMVLSLGALHSTCSMYTTDSELLAKGYVDEPELRDHAERVFKEIRAVCDKGKPGAI